MRIFCFIPARMGSSRFPGKPLFKILDKPLYLSRNHQNMVITSYNIFKENIFFGSGIKTFREECKKKKNIN